MATARCVWARIQMYPPPWTNTMVPFESEARGVTVTQGTPPMVVSSTTMSSGAGGSAATSASRIAVRSSAVGGSSGVRMPVATICSTIASCSTLGTGTP